MVHFTFIRHGESTDNLKQRWAGWKDAPLSNHGKRQARALASAFSNTHFLAIHSSDLQRAFTTASTILESQPNPCPPLISSHLFREQHFGAGEGKRFNRVREPDVALEDHFAKGQYPTLHGRHEKFPGGESLDDVRRRAEEVLEDTLLPYIRERRDDQHVAVVSHGIFISEIVAALIQRGGGLANSRELRGIRNTGWTRVRVDIQELSGAADEVRQERILVKITDLNRHEHLDKLHRQRGGVGSLAFDSKQKDIRSFFGKSKNFGQS